MPMYTCSMRLHWRAFVYLRVLLKLREQPARCFDTISVTKIVFTDLTDFSMQSYWKLVSSPDARSFPRAGSLIIMLLIILLLELD